MIYCNGNCVQKVYFQFLSNSLSEIGTATGCAVSRDDLKSIDSKCKSPILIGSGVTDGNVADYFFKSHGAIIGSYFKQNGHWGADLCETRITKLMERVHELRPSNWNRIVGEWNLCWINNVHQSQHRSIWINEIKKIILNDVALGSFDVTLFKSNSCSSIIDRLQFHPHVFNSAFWNAYAVWVHELNLQTRQHFVEFKRKSNRNSILLQCQTWKPLSISKPHHCHRI